MNPYKYKGYEIKADVDLLNHPSYFVDHKEFDGYPLDFISQAVAEIDRRKVE